MNEGKGLAKDLDGEVKIRIRAIILRQLCGAMGQVEDIAIDTPILGKGLGLDSMEALALVTEIEAEFGILIDDEELTENLFKNVGTLADLVRKKLSGNNSRGAAG